MPKKGAGAASKKNAAPSSSNDDGSYIIFGNAAPTKQKQKGKQADNPPAQRLKEGEAHSNQSTAKKPETRQLIGGASWTGKLPVNLLSEHCQKQKWAKPEYTMVSGTVAEPFALIANVPVPDQDIPGPGKP
ncbi:MAG: hypothetical protein Q9191_001911 [Dirinaria sp. TL-2023a]